MVLGSTCAYRGRGTRLLVLTALYGVLALAVQTVRMTPPQLHLAWWKRLLALVAPLMATVLGAAMAVQWALGAGDDFTQGPPGAATVGTWMAEHLPLMRDGEPVWAWRGPFFLSLAFVIPFVWEVTARVPSRAARWCTRAGLLAATAAIALQYSTPGYGWMFDLAALCIAVVGTTACGISGLRRATLPRRMSWTLCAALPLTPVAGFLTFWYLPPGLTMGLLLTYAMASALAGGPRTDEPNRSLPGAA